ASRHVLKTLNTLLDMSQSPVRVIRAIQGGAAFVQYDVIIPKELTQVIVLDASFPIRELCRLPGSTVQPLPDLDGRVKPCHQVYIETFGRETELNDYAHCKHVVLAGLVHRSEADIASAGLGEQDNLLGDVSRPTIERVLRGECSHIAYQAFNRGACRTTVYGH